MLLYLCNATRRRIDHVAKESCPLRRITDSLEIQREGNVSLDVLFVMRGAQFLQWRLILQLPLLENHLELHLRQSLIEALQTPVVLILERFVDLQKRGHPPVVISILRTAFNSRVFVKEQ